jgi:hypothetical protein
MGILFGACSVWFGLARGNIDVKGTDASLGTKLRISGLGTDASIDSLKLATLT